MNFEHFPNRKTEQDIVDGAAKRGPSGEIILLVVLLALILVALIFR